MKNSTLERYLANLMVAGEAVDKAAAEVRRLVAEEEKAYDRLCLALHAVTDEDDETGRGWQGDAALLAHRVKRLVEEPLAVIDPLEASDTELMNAYNGGDQ